jgi:hypothetical protein
MERSVISRSYGAMRISAIDSVQLIDFDDRLPTK